MKYTDITNDLWAMEIQPMLDTCLLLDSRLCANKLCELPRQRGDVRAYFQPPLPRDDIPVGVRAFDYKPYGEGEPSDPIFRDYMQVCTDILEVCPKMLSQRYTAWQSAREDVCDIARIHIKTSKTIYKNFRGEVMTGAEEKMPIVEFQKYREFNREYTGVNKPLFQIFFCCILVMWFAAMWIQVQNRLRCIAIVLSCPEWFYNDEDQGRIPVWVLCVYSIFSLLPETVITVVAFICGSSFLLTTTSYMDLLLNSLALVFVLEVDDLLYAAFATRYVNKWLNGLKLTELGCIATWTGHASASGMSTCCQVLVGAAVVVTACACALYSARWKTDSHAAIAEALTCLCQAEGPHCLTNLMLRGNATTSAYCN